MSSWTVATWNVNSLRARLANVLRYLDESQPDVLCLQETRVADAAFPRSPFEGRGYHVAMTSTGGYAGVAIASRSPFEEVRPGLPGFVETKAPGRRLACLTAGVWVDTVYVPTRMKIGKAEFLDALRADHDAGLGEAELVLAGDFNICFDERDYASPKMITDADVHPNRPEDRALRRLLEGRLVDGFRQAERTGGHFTWFANATWAIKRNYGMRLDYVFSTRSLAVEEAAHDRQTMGWAHPSDHVPVRVRFHRARR